MPDIAMRVWTLLSIILQVVVLGGIYLLLAESVDPLELVAAAGLAMITTAVLRLVSNNTPIHFRIELGQLRDALGLPYQIARDSAAVLIALPRFVYRRPERWGRFRQIPIAAVDDTPESAGRRAITIISISMPPNTFVVNIDRDRGCMTIHELLALNSDEHALKGGANA
jgi:multisubunit Na+/H+ antiporter MnhE subunit